MLVTDGLTSYKRVAKNLGRDVIHVEHAHEPPYGRLIIHQIRHERDCIVIKRFATTNKILVKNNLFLVQVSEAVEKKTIGKRGRPKGSKTKAKKSGNEGRNTKPEGILKVNHGTGEILEGKDTGRIVGGAAGNQSPKKKRAKPYRDGETRVFIYDAKSHRITGFDGKPADGSDVLERLLAVFEGKHITTNLSENKFSTTKHDISFRGGRDVEGWRELLRAYYTIRSCPWILDEVMEQLQLSPHFGTKMLSAISIEVAS